MHATYFCVAGTRVFFFFEEEKKRGRERETGSFRSRESKKGNWFGRGRSKINKWRAVCCER